MAAVTAAAAAVAVVTALYQLAWPVPKQGTKRMYTFYCCMKAATDVHTRKYTSLCWNSKLRQV
jgi:hypothetical protein